MLKQSGYKYTLGGGLLGALTGAALTKLTEDEEKKATLADYLTNSGIGLGLGAVGGRIIDSGEVEDTKPSTTDKTDTTDNAIDNSDNAIDNSDNGSMSTGARLSIAAPSAALGWALLNPSGKFSKLTRFDKIPGIKHLVEALGKPERADYMPKPTIMGAFNKTFNDTVGKLVHKELPVKYYNSKWILKPKYSKPVTIGRAATRVGGIGALGLAAYELAMTLFGK